MLTFVVCKKSHSSYFKSVFRGMRNQRVIRIIWTPKLNPIYEWLINLMAPFFRIHLVYLMPAYGLNVKGVYLTVVCHDLGHLDPEWNRDVNQDWILRSENSLRQANRIIYDTEFMRMEHMRLLQDKDYSVTNEYKVLHLKLAEQLVPVPVPVAKERMIDICSVGTSQERKNWPYIFQVLNQLTTPQQVTLIVDRQFHQKYYKEIAKAETVHRLDIRYQVSRAELNEILCNSRFYIQASLYEGFCVPVAEAILAGCTVLLRRNEVFEEVFEGMAVFLEGPQSMSDYIVRSPVQLFGDASNCKKGRDHFLNIQSYCSELVEL